MGRFFSCVGGKDNRLNASSEKNWHGIGVGNYLKNYKSCKNDRSLKVKVGDR